MGMEQIFFFIFAVFAIACSLLVVLKKNPVASAFSLVVVFFNFAAIYALYGAHLLAALQILVYAGAIMVLFVFVIMLLNADTPSLDMIRSSASMKAVGAGICLVGLAGVVWAIYQSQTAIVPVGNFTITEIEKAGGNTRVLSELMFSEYILPFELTSILLLAAIVGAVAISKRKMGGFAR